MPHERHVRAPAVWMAPDWASHPVIESFYGHARRARASSFYEVMCSPLNATPTTTLGRSSSSYEAKQGDDPPAPSRPFDSFAYSCTDTSEDESPLPSSLSQWNRRLSLGGIVPVPERPFNASVLENPLPVSVDTEEERPHSPTSARLRVKLLESLRDMDNRIAAERKRLQTRRVKTVTNPPNVMWTLLCGARTDERHSDGLSFLTESVGVVVSNRALNQLQRHRRHVRGILQIVTAHNPDLELTERQLDSFEAADDMLANDIKYSVLCQQHKLLVTSGTQRKRALKTAMLNNGSDCFEKPHVKSAMLAKLLEAVSWYRLVQRNAREESASSVGVESAASSAPSSTAGGVSGLQELQVEKILDVLAGEEFYSDYNELMCQPDWWEIAQAHFENLIFSSRNSRICQWVLQLSKDVAAVSYEDLEEMDDGGRRSRTNSVVGNGVHHKSHVPQQASWTRDPPPEQILDFLDRLTSRVRREFDVPSDVSKSLHVFIQRTVFPRIAILCFNQRATRDCQRKDKLWRKKCVELSGLPMENLGVSHDLVDKIQSNLPSRRIRRSSGSGGGSPCQRRVYFVRAIEAFNGMVSVVPCDLLEELMHGVVVLHHEAAVVLGTTQFSVETFFPLLAYVLVHCRLPLIHAQLHLLENFAITADNANGEESYYVYCVHAAVEYVCNTAGLGAGTNTVGTMSTSSSTVSTPGGAGLTSVAPMANSPPKTHAAFALDGDDENDLALELEVKVVSPSSLHNTKTVAMERPEEAGMPVVHASGK